MPSENDGVMIVLSSPSGAGKTTMVKGLMASSTLSLGFSISATTRPPRGDEKEGEAYYYLTQKEFDSKVKKGDQYEINPDLLQSDDEQVNNEILYSNLLKSNLVRYLHSFVKY